MYPYSLSESDEDDDYDDVVYGGYAWNEYVMPKTTKKGKSATIPSDISEELQIKSRGASSVLRSVDGWNSDSIGVFGNSTRGQKMAVRWVPFAGSKLNELSQKSPSLDTTTLFTEITRLSQPSTIQPEVDSIVTPEKQQKPVHIPCNHFPSIIPSQSISSHSQTIPSNSQVFPSPSQSLNPHLQSVIRPSQLLPSHIVSSQQSHTTKKRERIDWSVINKSKFYKQSFETTVVKKPSQSAPLSKQLAHLQQLPSSTSMKRPAEYVLTKSESNVHTISEPTNKEWRTMLDEESKQIPEFISSNSVLGELSLQLREVVVSRDSLGTIPDVDTQSIPYNGETIVVKKEMRYAKVVWMDDNPSVQRIVLAVNDFSTDIQLVLLLLSVHVVERIGIQLGSIMMFSKQSRIIQRDGTSLLVGSEILAIEKNPSIIQVFQSVEYS